MKKVGITQRVEYIKQYNERRDCLDQKWTELFHELGFITIPLPNLKQEVIPSLLDVISLDLIVFSGGNTLSHIQPESDSIAPERDQFEFSLLDEGLKRNIPILGVCRGMQMINIIMGGSLSKIENHVGVKHKIEHLDHQYVLSETVNSFHEWGIKDKDLSKNLTAIAKDKNGNIEAFIHKNRKILGIMWHPEREIPFDANDLKLIKKML